MTILDLPAIVEATAVAMGHGGSPDPYALADAARTRPATNQPGTLSQMLRAADLYVALPADAKRRFPQLAWQACLDAALPHRQPGRQTMATPPPIPTEPATQCATRRSAGERRSHFGDGASKPVILTTHRSARRQHGRTGRP